MYIHSRYVHENRKTATARDETKKRLEAKISKFERGKKSFDPFYPFFYPLRVSSVHASKSVPKYAEAKSQS
jgi:hypothetical protein